jgi:hypothetical protein
MLTPKKEKAKPRFTFKEKVKIAKTMIKSKLTPLSKESRQAQKDWKKEQDALKTEFPDAYNKRKGGTLKMKKGGATKDDKWIQKAVNPKHKGYCTPVTKKTCTPKRKALARTLKKISKNR